MARDRARTSRADGIARARRRGRARARGVVVAVAARALCAIARARADVEDVTDLSGQNLAAGGDVVVRARVVTDRWLREAASIGAVREGVAGRGARRGARRRTMAGRRRERWRVRGEVLDGGDASGRTRAVAMGGGIAGARVRAVFGTREILRDGSRGKRFAERIRV